MKQTCQIKCSSNEEPWCQLVHMDHPGATKEAEQPKGQQVEQRSFAVQIHKFCVQVPRTFGK